MFEWLPPEWIQASARGDWNIHDLFFSFSEWLTLSLEWFSVCVFCCNPLFYQKNISGCQIKHNRPRPTIAVIAWQQRITYYVYTPQQHLWSCTNHPLSHRKHVIKCPKCLATSTTFTHLNPPENNPPKSKTKIFQTPKTNPSQTSTPSPLLKELVDGWLVGWLLETPLGSRPLTGPSSSKSLSAVLPALRPQAPEMKPGEGFRKIWGL